MFKRKPNQTEVQIQTSGKRKLRTEGRHRLIVSSTDGIFLFELLYDGLPEQRFVNLPNEIKGFQQGLQQGGMWKLKKVMYDLKWSRVD